jgi:ligand-binding SRPBCC domain-containing protein
MTITISTLVQAHFLRVKSLFDQQLFKSLNPPFPPVKLLQFDGQEAGDRVGLELNFIFFKQKWVSQITENETTQDEWFFVDEGVELPFFLRSWRHKHRVIRVSETESEIRDEIKFHGSMALLTPLLFPMLYVQFLYRKPIYKKYIKDRAYPI